MCELNNDGTWKAKLSGVVHDVKSLRNTDLDHTYR